MARNGKWLRWVAALLAGACSVALALALLGGGAAAAGGGHVTIANFTYQPKTLHVAKGTAVKWTNTDRAKHTATKKGAFNTGKLKKGQSATITFKHAGTFKYICKLHPFMHGKIVVG